jgi:hypothetical protein
MTNSMEQRTYGNNGSRHTGLLSLPQEPSTSPCPKPKQFSPFTPSLFIKLTAIIYIICTRFKNYFLLSGFTTKILAAFFFCPSRPVITLVISDEDHRLWCSFLQLHSTVELHLTDAGYPDQLGPSRKFVENSTKLTCPEITGYRIKYSTVLWPIELQIRRGRKV